MNLVEGNARGPVSADLPNIVDSAVAIFSYRVTGNVSDGATTGVLTAKRS